MADKTVQIKQYNGNSYDNILPKTTASQVSCQVSGISSTNVNGAISELFTSVSNGKSLIASAITDKGIPTSGSDSFLIMSQNIGNISTLDSIPFLNADSSLIIPKWYTQINVVSFSLYKNSYVEISRLNNEAAKNAICFLVINFNGTHFDILFTGLNTEYNCGYWNSTYGNIFIAKLEKNQDGKISLFLKLSNSAPWGELWVDRSYYRFDGYLIEAD